MNLQVNKEMVMVPTFGSIPEALDEYVNGVVLQHRSRRDVEFKHYHGHNFRVSPSVYSPFIGPSGYLSCSFAGLPIFSGKRVLEIGCGSGISTALIASSGATSVYGTDINPVAISDSIYNASIVSACKDTAFIVGDLFDAIPPTASFDIIFANLPFMDRNPTDMLDRAFFDRGLLSVRRFIAEVTNWLTADGRAYLCLGECSPSDLRIIAVDKGLEWNEFFFTMEAGIMKTWIVEIRRISQSDAIPVLS